MYEPERSLEPPEPRVFGECEACRDIIAEGDEIVEYGGGTFHKDCFADAAPTILRDYFGAKDKIAGQED